MNTSKFVAEKLAELKNSGKPLQVVAWEFADICCGWAYVFGARGQECTPANRRSRYNGTNPGKDKDNIKNKCRNFDGAVGCNGCKWLPGGERTRFFDCRGFTYWVLQQVYGFTLQGAGATSQWNTASNWKAKGEISTMPRDSLVCLFAANGKTMEHTGFGFNDECIDCGGKDVYHYPKRNKMFTHWAIPVCIEGDVPPTPDPPQPEKPTLRRGSRGEYVTLAQAQLIQKGYSCGASGADGIFGASTENAVRAFQRDHFDPNGNPLKVDGIIGRGTWAALLSAEPATKYTVTIPRLSKSQADALILQYPGSTMTEERG